MKNNAHLVWHGLICLVCFLYSRLVVHDDLKWVPVPANVATPPELSLLLWAFIS